MNRRPWESEDYRMSTFAAAGAVLAQSLLGQRSPDLSTALTLKLAND
jgi:hypothetical protein